MLRHLLGSEHPIASLYRGLTPNLVGNASSWAIFFYIKSKVENQIRRFHSRQKPIAFHRDRDLEQRRNETSLSPLDYFVASGLSGLVITFVTNPIWVLKTRMLSSDKGSAGAYSSMWEGIRLVAQQEGWRGFYRGLGISCLGVLHGAVQFGAYEPLKRVWAKHISLDSEERMSTAATLIISGMSKIIAGTATYPYQVVRSRLQTYDSERRFGKGITGVTARVWKELGWKGFYRGLGPNIVRVLPATWVTFLVYENVRWWLPRWEDIEGEN